MTHTAMDGARLLAAAQALAPTIAGMRDRIEHERRLPAELVAAMHGDGFFTLWLPRALGGPELSLADCVRVLEALARADGSVGWCATVSTAYSRLAGYLPEAVARRIFVEDRASVSGAIMPTGQARPVPGGFRLTGRWGFGSGILHSRWVIGACVMHGDDGEAPRRRPDGALDTRIAFFPTEAAEVVDTWDVGGLRGTGSHDYQVADLFVPDAYMLPSEDPTRPGPLYGLSRHTAYPAAIVAVPLGIARAALDAFREMAAAKVPRIGTAVLRDKPVVQAGVGRAEAMLRAARAFLLETCDAIWADALEGRAPTLEQRALMRLACAQVAEAAKAVVTMLHDLGGATVVYESSPLQRCFRDVHAASQHIQAHSANFESGGRVMLGLEPGTAQL